MGGKKGITKA